MSINLSMLAIAILTLLLHSCSTDGTKQKSIKGLTNQGDSLYLDNGKPYTGSTFNLAYNKDKDSYSGVIKNGKKEDEWIFVNSLGDTISKEIYKNGNIIKRYNYFQDTHSIESYKTYINGTSDSTIEYNTVGQIIRLYRYDGDFLSVKHFSGKGTLEKHEVINYVNYKLYPKMYAHGRVYDEEDYLYIAYAENGKPTKAGGEAFNRIGETAEDNYKPVEQETNINTTNSPTRISFQKNIDFGNYLKSHTFKLGSGTVNFNNGIDYSVGSMVINDVNVSMEGKYLVTGTASVKLIKVANTYGNYDPTNNNGSSGTLYLNSDGSLSGTIYDRSGNSLNISLVPIN